MKPLSVRSTEAVLYHLEIEMFISDQTCYIQMLWLFLDF